MVLGSTLPSRKLPYYHMVVSKNLPVPPRRVLIVDREREPIAALLRQKLGDVEFRTADRNQLSQAELNWAQAYVGFRPPPDLALDELEWIHCTGAGVDAFLFRRHFPATTLLTRTGEGFGTQIGEWCVARALADTQELLVLAQDQSRRLWSQRYIRPLIGRRVVIAGTGEVGRGVAAAFKAIGCEVTGVSRSGTLIAPFHTVFSVDRFVEAIQGAEYLILTLPLTEATWHLVNGEFLSSCRNLTLMNVGRGGLIDETSLLEALNAGWITKAMLDVFEIEPLPVDSLLWDHPRVMVSPHLAGLTTVEGAANSFLEVVDSLRSGKHPRLMVDQARGY